MFSSSHDSHVIGLGSLLSLDQLCQLCVCVCVCFSMWRFGERVMLDMLKVYNTIIEHYSIEYGVVGR